VFLVTGRIAAYRRYFLFVGQKSGFSPRRGDSLDSLRLVAPIQVKLCRTDGHLGPLTCAKFYLNRHRGWECGPKISKMSTFLHTKFHLSRIISSWDIPIKPFSKYRPSAILNFRHMGILVTWPVLERDSALSYKMSR